MIIGEISTNNAYDAFYPVAPNVFAVRPFIEEQADWWTDVFGAPDETSTEKIYIDGFTEDYTTKYTSVSSYVLCVETEMSFYWDDANQILYVNFQDGSSWYTSYYEYTTSVGYTDKDNLYIDDVLYRGLLTGFPDIAQQQDIQSYDQLAFITGSMVLNNTGDQLSWMKDTSLYGQSVYLYYLKDSLIVDGGISRDDLTALRSFYIDNKTIGIQENTLSLQDPRAAQSVSIPADLFSTDDYPNLSDTYDSKCIPLIYGQVSEVPAIPVTGEADGDVTFKVCKTLTALGQVQVYSDDAWSDVTPESTDLDNGEFVLSYSDCRDDGTTTGTLLECQVLSATGVENTYASDTIKQMNDEVLEVALPDSDYDAEEWAAEEVYLSPIGFYLDSQITLYEAIRLVQAGANRGFRYEVEADGKRTIRVDRDDRETSGIIHNQYISNVQELEVETDSDLLAAIATVNYNKNYQEDEYLTYSDDSEEETVRKAYRQTPTLEADTYLYTAELAAERATWMLGKYSTIPETTELSLLGDSWYTIRIYDIYTIELTPGFVDLDSNEITGREFYGVWKCKVIEIDPDFDELGNTIKVELIEKVTFEEQTVVTADPERYPTDGTSITEPSLYSYPAYPSK